MTNNIGMPLCPAITATTTSRRRGGWHMQRPSDVVGPEDGVLPSVFAVMMDVRVIGRYTLGGVLVIFPLPCDKRSDVSDSEWLWISFWRHVLTPVPVICSCECHLYPAVLVVTSHWTQCLIFYSNCIGSQKKHGNILFGPLVPSLVIEERQRTLHVDVRPLWINTRFCFEKLYNNAY